MSIKENKAHIWVYTYIFYLEEYKSMESAKEMADRAVSGFEKVIEKESI